jgi:hypothetical protein
MPPIRRAVQLEREFFSFVLEIKVPSAGEPIKKGPSPTASS